MIKKLLFAILIVLIGMNNCYAFGGFTINVPTLGSGETSDEESTEPKHSWTDDSNSNISYSCDYEYSINYSDDVKVYGYNMNGESIFDGTIIPSEEAKAGTFIGLRIVEVKTVSYTIDSISVTKTTTVPGSGYTCYGYSTTTQICDDNLWATIVNYRLPLLSIRFPRINKTFVPSWCHDQTTYNCISGEKKDNWYSETNVGCCYANADDVIPESVTTGTHYTTCENYAKSAAQAAANAVMAMGPSYELNLHNPNSGKSVVKQISANTCNNRISGTRTSATCNYEYRVNKVCMNTKTAKVEYRQNSCPQGYVEIPDGQTIENGETINYWKYFIPLDAKSNESFQITMSPKSTSAGEVGSEKNIEICNRIVDGYTDFHLYIIKANGENFTLGRPQTAKNYIKDHGCKIASTIEIPVSQHFYNEVDNNDNKKFHGYKFYYRPIDVNNPFPNNMDIDNRSYWYEFAEKNTAGEVTRDANNRVSLNINLNSNFSNDNITYKTNGINITAISNANRTYNYNNWSNMDINGSSNFIENNGSWLLRNNTQYYKLGCGTSNSNWCMCNDNAAGCIG